MIINAFLKVREEHPGCLLWLAPRHPQRTDDILTLIAAAQLTAIRRSSGQRVDDATEILVIDTLGELPGFMGLASSVFMGGSLVAHGGHNPLEALVFGKPVITGPFTTNFADLYQTLEIENLVTVVSGVDELAVALGRSLRLEQREHYATQGPRFIDQHRGAIDAQYEIIENALSAKPVLL